MPHNGCPIVNTALTCIRANRDEIDWFNTHSCSDWDELEESYDISDESIRLRAFYVVELFYAEIIPRLLFLDSNRSPYLKFIASVYPRTTEGLLQLSVDMDQFRKRTAAQAAVLTLTTTASDNHMPWVKPYERAAALTAILLTIIEVLRGCLSRGDTERLTLVGTALFDGMVATHCTSSDMELELRTILTIHKENAIAPWQRKKTSQG